MIPKGLNSLNSLNSDFYRFAPILVLILLLPFSVLLRKRRNLRTFTLPATLWPRVAVSWDSVEQNFLVDAMHRCAHTLP